MNFKIIMAVIVFTLLNVSYGESRQIVEERGGKVKVVKYDDGTWELLVDGKPCFMKGVTFVPVRIGLPRPGYYA